MRVSFDEDLRALLGRRSTPALGPISEQEWDVAHPVNHGEDVYGSSELLHPRQPSMKRSTPSALRCGRANDAGG
jgi:hypothetical protein